MIKEDYKEIREPNNQATHHLEREADEVANSVVSQTKLSNPSSVYDTKHLEKKSDKPEIQSTSNPEFFSSSQGKKLSSNERHVEHCKSWTCNTRIYQS